MASTISIKTGNLTAQTQMADDAKAQEILARYAAFIGAEGNAQQQLDAVVKNLAQIIQSGARDYDYRQRSAEVLATVDEDNQFETVGEE